MSGLAGFLLVVASWYVDRMPNGLSRLAVLIVGAALLAVEAITEMVQGIARRNGGQTWTTTTVTRQPARPSQDGQS